MVEVNRGFGGGMGFFGTAAAVGTGVIAGDIIADAIVADTIVADAIVTDAIVDTMFF
jgi:hypothetical protein